MSTRMMRPRPPLYVRLKTLDSWGMWMCPTSNKDAARGRRFVDLHDRALPPDEAQNCVSLENGYLLGHGPPISSGPQGRTACATKANTGKNVNISRRDTPLELSVSSSSSVRCRSLRR